MKKLLLGTLLTLMSVSSAFAAHPQCGKTELAEIMDIMKDDMKAIKAATKAKEQDKVTALAEKLLVSVQKADAYVPLKISDSKELNAQQTEQFNDYKKGMELLTKAVVELTKADSIEAQKIALAVIGKSAKKGHKAFKMDCDDV
ncbi:hypothetical protein [Thalassotalea aquiviva]|uniref:hypothetical protein n=1 Tax=Thalassotalea aquiviva TaxID=3242415 RepID=UPI00352B0C40